MEDKLLETEQEIFEIEARLESGGGFWFKFWNLPQQKRRLKILRNKQLHTVDAFLAEQNEEYKAIVQHQYQLLRTDEINFSVYSKGYTFKGSHSTRIEGSIYPNGYSYCQSVRTNYTILPFSSFEYPSGWIGKVDYWGEIRLDKSDTQYGLLRSLPETYQGYVDEEGLIKLKVTEVGYGDIIDKNVTLGKLIANHFEYDERRNENFQNNKNLLMERIGHFRALLRQQL